MIFRKHRQVLVMEMIELLLVLMMTVRMVEMENDQLVVETSDGAVRGERIVTDTGKQVDLWNSVPFAEPPTGNLRYSIL